MISLAPKLETWARTCRGNSIAQRLAGVVRTNSHLRSRVSLLRPLTANQSFPAQSSRYEVLNFVTRQKAVIESARPARYGERHVDSRLCRCIVSWNFWRIVHFDKIPLYHGVNLSTALRA